MKQVAPPSAVRAKARLHVILHRDRKLDASAKAYTVEEYGKPVYNVTIIDRHPKKQQS